ncbi:MAG: dihydroneopterin aldolase, partial [Tardiphaga sp.]
IDAVKVTVHKPHAPIAAIFEDVGVVLTRKRQSP